MISWRHLKVSVSTKKQVMLVEYEVSVIVCSKDYFNTQIKKSIGQNDEKKKWKIKRKFPRQLEET